MLAGAGTCCVAYVPDCAGSVGGGHSLLFVTFEGVTAISIIITVYQTARRHMPEEHNFVHLYLLLCVYVIVLCFVDKIRNSSNPAPPPQKKNTFIGLKHLFYNLDTCFDL